MPHTQVVIVVDVESRELYSNIYPQMFLVNQLLFLNPFQRRTRSSKKCTEFYSYTYTAKKSHTQGLHEELMLSQFH